jgi:CRP-like cAMP-binding protein
VFVITFLVRVSRVYLEAMGNMTLSNDPRESISSYFREGPLKRFSKAEVLVHGDEEPSGVYLVQLGYVKAYTISQLGHQNLLLIHGAHEIMPLPWALDGPQKVGVFYEAMSAVSVLSTSKDSLRTAMGLNSWLTEQVLGQLVNTFTVYAQRIQNLGYRSPRERVVSCLLDLAARFGERSRAGVTIRAPITHQDIADSISMSRETASRALESLFENNLISQNDHLFVILDEEKLQAELR